MILQITEKILLQKEETMSNTTEAKHSRSNQSDIVNQYESKAKKMKEETTIVIWSRKS